MRREPSLTLGGALRILGRHELPQIKKLDQVLGGLILTAGAGAGIAAVGSAVMAPLGMFAAVWGWVEQKDVALALLRDVISGVSRKLAGTAGQERRELIASAHSVIVVAAFFESFREHVGKDFYDRLEITEKEKQRLIVRDSGSVQDSGLYGHLYAAEIPAPSAARGFEENVKQVKCWYEDISKKLNHFLQGLATGESGTIGRRTSVDRIDWKATADRAAQRYSSHFLTLASKVPEFMIWALLGEGAATRSMIADLRVDIGEALAANRDALGRMNALLALDSGCGAPTSGLWQAVARSNLGILSERIVPEDAQGYGGIEFPTVEESYINPRYRQVRVVGPVPAADERYWDDQPSRDDFDLMLAGYVTSPDATRLPMLLLGHPGAGKSMLTKVFAARLPTSAYTVIRVPLRRVGANAPVVNQIEQALSLATNRRVDSWWQLAEQSADTIRVVLLDGLDELLQASNSDRSGYLQEVEDFQRAEAQQQQPVVVIVTSRTVVADRVDIPYGTSIVKLDFFSDTDITEWLRRWRRANAGGIASGTVRELTLDAITSTMATDAYTKDSERTEEEQQKSQAGRKGTIRDLAQQPLLLLMLALYAADPAVAQLDASLATADLYQRLLENFARREVVKVLGPRPRRAELEDQVHDHLERLAIAALAMFNRGRQDIAEEDLGADLAALDPGLMERSRPVEAGQRIIAHFFFVHAPEAHTLTGPGDPRPDNSRAELHRQPPRRGYEFLHATFGEYLVASRVIGELVGVAATAFARRRGALAPDDLLYALLSHQLLGARRSTLDFAREIYVGQPKKDRQRVLELLPVLLSNYRDRHGSDRYTGYRPMPADQIRELACYSANLVALRCSLVPDSRVALTELFRAQGNALELWRSTAMLWKAGLDADGLQSMLETVELSDEQTLISANAYIQVFSKKSQIDVQSVWNEISLARLTANRSMERQLRYGAAMVGHYYYQYGNEAGSWRDLMASWLISLIAGKPADEILIEAPEGTPDNDIRMVAGLIFRYLRTASYDKERDQRIIEYLFRLPLVFEIDQIALTARVNNEPRLAHEIPALANADLYGRHVVYLAHILPGINTEDFPGRALNAVEEILKEWMRRYKTWDFPVDYDD